MPIQNKLLPDIILVLKAHFVSVANSNGALLGPLCKQNIKSTKLVLKNCCLFYVLKVTQWPASSE